MMALFQKLLLAAFSLALLTFANAHDHPVYGAGVGETCGTKAGIACDEGLWCEHATGLCDAPDAAGVCIITPGRCAPQLLPDCGCDSKEYNRECDRRKVRVQKKADGACPKP